MTTPPNNDLLIAAALVALRNQDFFTRLLATAKEDRQAAVKLIRDLDKPDVVHHP